MTISVPLVYKNADYRLYEYRNLYYQWEDKTCVIDASSKYVVKDVKKNQVYSINDLDEETCRPETSKKCRVPPPSDDFESYCINTLLSSSAVSQVKLKHLLCLIM